MFRIVKSNRKFELCITAKRQNLSHVQWVAKYFEFLIGSWQQKFLCVIVKCYSFYYFLKYNILTKSHTSSKLKIKTKGSRLKWQRITWHKDAKSVEISYFIMTMIVFVKLRWSEFDWHLRSQAVVAWTTKD